MRKRRNTFSPYSLFRFFHFASGFVLQLFTPLAYVSCCYLYFRFRLPFLHIQYLASVSMSRVWRPKRYCNTVASCNSYAFSHSKITRTRIRSNCWHHFSCSSAVAAAAASRANGASISLTIQHATHVATRVMAAKAGPRRSIMQLQRQLALCWLQLGSVAEKVAKIARARIFTHSPKIAMPMLGSLAA